MAGFGVPEADIARVLAIDPKTLRKHYRDELDTGHVKATAKVAEFLYRKATTDGPQAVDRGHLLAQDPRRLARAAADPCRRLLRCGRLSDAELEAIIGNDLRPYPRLPGTNS